MDKKGYLKHRTVIEAWANGADIQCDLGQCGWCVVSAPEWREHREYRVKETTPSKPSINWDHVHSCYNWLAVDDGGFVYLFETKPTSEEHWWANCDDTYLEIANVFASCKRGTCHWTDSLVERPTEEKEDE